MKIGDKLKCVYSDDGVEYTVGQLYVIEGFDEDGYPCLRDNSGDLDKECGQPLDGPFWRFEEI